MKVRINTYFAVLFITIAGSGAALILVHIVNSNAFTGTFSSGVTKYDELQKSIPAQ